MHTTTLTGCILGIAAVMLVLAGDKALSQPVAPTNDAPNPYRSIENWGTLPGRAWGSTSAVGIDPDGTSVWVAERCGKSRPPSRIDPEGRRPSRAVNRRSIRSSSSIPPASS